MRVAVDPLMLPIRVLSIAVSTVCWAAHFIITAGRSAAVNAHRG